LNNKIAAGQGLVVVDRKSLVSEEMAKMFPHVKAGRGIKFNHGSAYAAGREAGSKATWHKPVGGNSGQLAISQG
jgi:hypothetical protein